MGRLGSEERFSSAQKVIVLRGARRILNRQGGWTKRRWYSEYGQCLAAACYSAAVRAGLIEDTNDPKTMRIITTEVGLDSLAREHGYRSATDFNDESQRGEVLRLIDERLMQLESV